MSSFSARNQEVDQDFLIYLFQAFRGYYNNHAVTLATLIARDMELNGGYAKERIWIHDNIKSAC